MDCIGMEWNALAQMGLGTTIISPPNTEKPLMNITFHLLTYYF